MVEGGVVVAELEGVSIVKFGLLRKFQGFGQGLLVIERYAFLRAECTLVTELKVVKGRHIPGLGLL